MGRLKKFASEKERQAAYRNRKRAEQGLEPVKSPAELRAEAQRVRAGEVAAIRASLIKRGAEISSEQHGSENHKGG
jgi:hypothetical protein